MLNKEFILSRITPYLNKARELSESEFYELFRDLSHKEHYEIINIMIENNIDYIDEKQEEMDALCQTSLLSSSPTIDYEKLKNISNEVLCVMAQNGDASALSALLDKNKRFIYKIALQANYSFKQNSLTLDDLFQEGNLGAIEAIHHFDVTQDIKFVTYSWHWIRQKITRAIMDKGFLIRIPVHKFDKMIKVLNCQKQNQYTTPKELSILINDLSEDEIIELLIISENYINTTSLNTLVGEDHSTELAELLPHNEEITLEDEIMSKMLQLELTTVLSTLKDRERQVLELRFGLVDGKQRTLEEVGEIFHVTHERIRQIEAKALRKLRHLTKTLRLKDFLNQ